MTLVHMTTSRIAAIAIPSPRNPSESTTPAAEIIRGHLVAASSTSELRRRLGTVTA